MKNFSILQWSLLSLALATLMGCGGGDSRTPDGVDPSTPSTEATSAGNSSGEPEVDLDAPLLEPFDAPQTLAEVEEGVVWKDGLVVDSFERLREWKQKNPPELTPAEALKLKNTSDENNDKIYAALSMPHKEDGSDINYDDTFNHAAIMDVSSLNPVLTSSIIEADYHVLTAANLFAFDWNMIPYADGDFVKEWKRSEDGLLEKIVLRDDLTWSDGKPITAHDIVFSFQLIMNPKVPIRAVRQGTDEIRWIEAYDDQTLVYWHKEPSVVSIWNLNFPIIPKHIYEESVKEDPTLKESDYHVQLELKPVTGGPYRLVKRERGQALVLERREEWYMKDGKQVRHKPHFREIRFKVLEDPNTRLLALKSGAVDEAELDPEEWMEKTTGDDFYKNNTKVRGEEWTYYFVAWNTKSPFFEDKRVRQAMALTMDHEEMLNELCYGLFKPSYGIFHRNSWMFPKSPTQAIDRFNHQNLDRAEELLDEAGWEDSDGDGYRDKMVNGRRTRFEFTIVVKNAADRVAICNLLREMLDQIGIICNVRPMESAAHQEEVFEKKFQASFMGWGSGADPYTNENIFGSGKQRNFGSYSNAQVDQWFKDAMVADGREARGAIYGKIHEQIYEDQPYMFLYTRSSFFGFNKRMRGYNFSPRGLFSYSPGIRSIWAD